MRAAGIERRHLAALVALLEHEGFAAAASAMYVTPSTFAATIRQVERLAGARLVERVRQGARLNARGREMADTAAEALRAMDGVLDDARRSSVAESGSLFVQTTPTLAEGLGAELLAGLMTRHPALRMSVRAPRRPIVADVAYSVAAAESDFGMTEYMTRPLEGTVQVPLGVADIAYAFPAYAEVDAETATLAHLEQFGLIVVPYFESSDVYAVLRSRTALVSRFIRARVSDRYAFADLALGGVGGFLCEYMHREELMALGLKVALFDEPFVRRFVTVARADDRRPLIATVLAQSVEVAARSYAARPRLHAGTIRGANS
ncbi:LysR family transcriptional regulator [Cumulibacter manganitolerans]|uniref:LysR family transcriptional regulator n=1 Tax=Cumulibacter manganitolerans TaxID=1884992 RepID=UPI0012976736|nr:LysR family transcriptional regulator [Cumulibacter manganitolerans]